MESSIPLRHEEFSLHKSFWSDPQTIRYLIWQRLIPALLVNVISDAGDSTHQQKHFIPVSPFEADEK